MFTQFSESEASSVEEPCNVIAECLACCTLLLRYLLCLGPRPARTRSTGVEAQEYTAPTPSGSSGSARSGGEAEASASGRSQQQNEGQPLLKTNDSSSEPAGTVDQELQGFWKGALKQKEGLELGSSDEDACPTCLELYTEENPAIETKCHHRFHLACIFEWLERSKTCPVCARKMEFEELL